MFHLFIVEDDPKITKLLQSHLENYGYMVSVVTNFSNVLHQFEATKPDLILLDVNLPMYDGYYWCRLIRQQSTCPILFISAREGKMDQVMALENGADDYITKPFDYEIIVAKIRSHLRRAYGSYAANKEERKIQVSDLILWPEKLLLRWKDAEVNLGYKETQLLETLMKNHSTVISRDRLLDKLWDDTTFVDENTLNVYIARVRKKLKELGIEDTIETIRGFGYRFLVTWR
ncbi:response regulator transcription factor [Shimazuella kribbensis]|uniref:response regulator transcription factor n=1 Tax=Shimazuella kribbensis TaxID=139808 RepID=UPI000413CC97|nr:response regulator transcription factor [Shimazuella kribbensis]